MKNIFISLCLLVGLTGCAIEPMYPVYPVQISPIMIRPVPMVMRPPMPMYHYYYH